MKTRGLTLIEIVVGVSLVTVLITVFGVSLLAAVFAQRVKLRNMASALADQQLATIRWIDTSQLTDQANGPLLGLLFTQGNFRTIADPTAPSQSRVLGAATSTYTGLTSVLPFPRNAYDDFDLSVRLKVNQGAPIGWKTGVLFRTSDLRNGYRAYLTANSFTLQKVVNDVVTTLYTDARAISPGSWHRLGVTATGPSIAVTLNGMPITTQNDSSFTSGQSALAVWEGASANFDDVTVDGESWNFDAATIGDLPDDWLRFGLGDLPNGTSTLTISSPYGDDSYKRYSVNVSWMDRSGTTRSVSHNTEKAN